MRVKRIVANLLDLRSKTDLSTSLGELGDSMSETRLAS
jgi:hypothetical protein